MKINKEKLKQTKLEMKERAFKDNTIDVDRKSMSHYGESYSFLKGFCNLILSGKYSAEQAVLKLSKDSSKKEAKRAMSALKVMLQRLGISKSAYNDLFSSDSEVASDELETLKEALAESSGGKINKIISKALLEVKGDDIEMDNTAFPNKQTCQYGRKNKINGMRIPLQGNRVCKLGVANGEKAYWRLPKKGKKPIYGVLTAIGANGKKVKMKLSNEQKNARKHFGTLEHKVRTAGEIKRFQRSMKKRRKLGMTGKATQNAKANNDF